MTHSYTAHARSGCRKHICSACTCLPSRSIAHLDTRNLVVRGSRPRAEEFAPLGKLPSPPPPLPPHHPPPQHPPPHPHPPHHHHPPLPPLPPPPVHAVLLILFLLQTPQ